MHKAEKKTEAVRKYMEQLELHNGQTTVYWEDNTSCIYVFESKRVTPIVKHIAITVCFLQENFASGLFATKYERSSVVSHA